MFQDWMEEVITMSVKVLVCVYDRRERDCGDGWICDCHTCVALLFDKNEQGQC